MTNPFFNQQLSQQQPVAGKKANNNPMLDTEASPKISDLVLEQVKNGDMVTQNEEHEIISILQQLTDTFATHGASAELENKIEDAINYYTGKLDDGQKASLDQFKAVLDQVEKSGAEQTKYLAEIQNHLLERSYQGPVQGKGYGAQNPYGGTPQGDPGSDIDTTPLIPNNIFAGNNDGIEQLARSKASFFTLLMVALLYGYRVASDTASLQIIKQKRAQNAAGAATELEKMLTDLKELITKYGGTGGDSDPKDLYAMLQKMENSKDDPQAKQAAIDFFNTYRSDFGATGIDPSKLKWDGSDADKKNFDDMFNNLIGIVNDKLKANGVTGSNLVKPFPVDKDGNISLDGLSDLVDDMTKNCEAAATQLNAILNTIQNYITTSNATISSLLDWLKQNVSSYGSAIRVQ